MLTEKTHEAAHDRPIVVALGKPDFFEWRLVSAVARHTLSLGLHLDAKLAMSQHREMVDVYERASSNAIGSMYAPSSSTTYSHATRAS
ncbi:MAG: hypothetical protein JSS54_05400 [Proteobacteria bacterium]|nr:hypothetical protein [Pseudomonadota bacterium]